MNGLGVICTDNVVGDTLLKRLAMGKLKCAAASFVNYFPEGSRRMSLARRLGFCENGVEYAVLAVFEGGEI